METRRLLGELSELSRRGGGRFTHLGESRKHPVTAPDFLREVLRPRDSGDPSLDVDGVAWHPYQHRLSPTRGFKRKGFLSRNCGKGRSGGRRSDSGCGRGDFGIGDVGRIQNLLDNLWRETDVSSKRWLANGGTGRPALFLTEFGYFNRPLNKADIGHKKPERRNYWHSERRRAGWFPHALSQARRNQARWMILYHGIERPLEPPPPKPPGPPGPPVPVQKDYRNDWDSGLFKYRDVIGESRDYGKGPDGSNITTPQRRQAYCAIWEWAKGKRRPVDPNNGCAAILQAARGG